MYIYKRTFFQKYWQKRPFVLRQFLPGAMLSQFTVTRFYQWCKPPAEARLFVRTEEIAPGSAHAFPLKSICEGPAIFRHCRGRGDCVTLLLNRVDLVEPSLNQLRERFMIPYFWREHDIVATLSLRRAGIGFHAGHEDGFILQLQGSRRWSVWERELLDDHYRRKLLGDVSVGSIPPPARPSRKPLMTCVLMPGDALFLPSLFGHEGVTVRDSISLSVAWAAFTPYKILCAAGQELLPFVFEGAQKDPEAFFRLIQDPPSATEDPVGFLLEQLKPCLKLIASRVDSHRIVRKYLEVLLRR